MAINLPGGFNILNNEPVDARLTLPNSSSRYALSSANVYEGLPVYQQDDKNIYVLINTSSISDPNSWKSLGNGTDTASFNAFTSSYNTGSFTGSFTGNFNGSGADLFDIPSTAIVGLNLSQITSGSVSASISPDLGLQVNTNITATSFSGSFSGSGNFSGTLTVGAYTLPSTDGSSNQVLKTDGSGALSWQNDNGIALTSLSATTPLLYNNTTGDFSISQSNTSTNGYLSSTDWNTFNDKQTALGFTPENIANKKTTLADNSDTYYPTQKAVKTAVDAKQDAIIGAASTIISSNLTANRTLLSDASGKVAVSSITNTELGYLGGVTSAIQTQINNKISTSHTVNNISNGTGFLKNNGSGTWSYDNNSYVDLSSNQTITGEKTVTNNFKIKDDNGIAISDTKLVLENAKTATISDTIAVAPYILFSSKTFVSDASGDYSGQSNNMEWRIRQTLAPAGQVYGQDNRLYFDYKNGNAGSWKSAVSISKDGVQGNITGIDQMTLGNFIGNRGKITFKNVGGYTAGSIEANGNVLRVSDGSSAKIEFFNNVVYYGGFATSTGSQLSANGWAFAKNANSTFTASALLHLDKNRSTAGNAPIKFTLDGAALLATPERGALEAMPYSLHFTDSSNQRNTLAYLSDVYKTPMNVADSNYTVVGNEIIIGYTGLTADRACTLPNPASHAGKSLTLFAKGMNDYDLNFSSSYKPKNLNDSTITSVKGDLPKHGVDTGSAIEGVSMKLVSFNNEWVILNYFTHYK